MSSLFLRSCTSACATIQYLQTFLQNIEDFCMQIFWINHPVCERTEPSTLSPHISHCFSSGKGGHSCYLEGLKIQIRWIQEMNYIWLFLKPYLYENTFEICYQRPILMCFRKGKVLEIAKQNSFLGSILALFVLKLKRALFLPITR